MLPSNSWRINLSVQKENTTIRGRIQGGEPNPIDKHVGNRIKLRRSILGISQEQLAKLMGITFQQVQKYENGVNRVGASRLYDIGKVLGVSVDFFFEDIDKNAAEQSPRMLSLIAPTDMYLEEDVKQVDIDPMKRQETLELVRAYYAIKNRDVAKQMLDLMINLADNPLQDILLDKKQED